MELGELIERLEIEEPEKIIKFGFHNPHSYRGYYDQVAFEPSHNIKIADMLQCAKSALGNTYTGWKGLEFTMDSHTNCNLSERGECTSWDDSISLQLLNYMLKDKV